MVIKIPELKDFSLVSSDEQKLNQIELQSKVIAAIGGDLYSFSVVESKIGKLIFFNDSIQGGYINYNTFWGGLPYTRYFALSLVIKEDIKNVLVLGLGSGSVINDFIKIKTIKNIVSVEICQNVIKAYYNYFNLYKSSDISIIHNDAYNYLNENKLIQDLIIMDIFHNEGIPAKFMGKSFISNCYKSLESDGILAINFFGTENINDPLNKELLKLLYLLRSIFPSIYVFPVLYGAYEYYRLACDLRYNLSPLTNIVIIASKKEELLSYGDIQTRSKSVYNELLRDIYPNFLSYARDNRTFDLFLKN